MFLSAIVLQSFLLLISPYARAGGQATVTKTPAPEWAEPISLDPNPGEPPAGVTGGEWFLLNDRQIEIGREGEYIHFASKFTSAAGVRDGSRIEIDFDPTYETLALHSLVVYRDGKAVDRLPNQDIKILQREADLDQGLYDGSLSAVLILPDIRVGDTLEYAYSRTGRNPIFKHRFSESFTTQWSYPVRRFSIRLICPDGREFHFKPRLTESVPAPELVSGAKVYTWDRSNISGLIADGDLPKWYNPYPGFEVSEFESWSAVANWAVKLFAMPETMPDAIQVELKEFRNHETAEEQIMAALRYVQDTIRYLGLEVGVNSHEPYPIDVVLERRFGDCKDKARLLCAILRSLGFDAAPALVNVNLRQTLTDRLPAPTVFNHAVVRLRFHDRDYWLDPTRQHQGGSLETVYFSPLGKALVVDPSTTELSEITPSGVKETLTSVVETFSMKSYIGKCHLHVVSKMSGRDADTARGTLSSESIPELSKRYVNFYAQDYPAITVSEQPRIHDDLAKNEIEVQEDYDLADLWHPDERKTSKFKSFFYQRLTRDALTIPDTLIRSMPFAIEYPLRYEQTICIELPERMKASHDTLDVIDPSFRFAYNELADAEGNQLLRSSYEALASNVEGSRTAQYVANIDKVKEQLGYYVWVNKSVVTKDAPASPVSINSTPVPRPQAEDSVSKFLVMLPFAILAGVMLRRFTRREARLQAHEPQALHRCVVCGRTDVSHPETEFRVNRTGHDFCIEHLGK